MVTLAFANLRTTFYSNVFEVLTCHYENVSHQRSGSSKLSFCTSQFVQDWLISVRNTSSLSKLLFRCQYPSPCMDRSMLSMIRSWSEKK